MAILIRTKKIEKRLEYLRGEIEKGTISQSEILELQSLAKYIEAGDVELLQWAGVPEFADNYEIKNQCLQCMRAITNEEFENEDYFVVTRGFTPEAIYNYLCFACVMSLRDKQPIGFWD